MRSPASPTIARRPTFAQVFDPKNNAFGFLRLALAIAVIYSHSISLGGFGRDPVEAFTHRRYTIGLVSVAMFFVLSGFLICRSASGSNSVPRFLWHRFLRIFPAYWVCLLVCGCIFAPLFAFAEHGTLLGVFSVAHNSPQDFVLQNAGLLHGNEFSISGIMVLRPMSIAGLLSHNPVAQVINGSLWTLPFEFGCYLAVAALSIIGVLRRARSIVLVLFVTLWALHLFDSANPAEFWSWFPYAGVQQLVMLGCYFAAGCASFLFREKIPHSTALFVISVAVLGLSVPCGGFAAVAPLAMAYAFLWLAFSLPFARFDARGDFSYGTYIYAFPVQQGLALLNLQREGFSIYFICSLLLTSVFAFLSYRLIEAPCLRWKAAQLPAFRKRTSMTEVPVSLEPDTRVAS